MHQVIFFVIKTSEKTNCKLAEFVLAWLYSTLKQQQSQQDKLPSLHHYCEKCSLYRHITQRVLLSRCTSARRSVWESQQQQLRRVAACKVTGVSTASLGVVLLRFSCLVSRQFFLFSFSCCFCPQGSSRWVNCVVGLLRLLRLRRAATAAAAAPARSNSDLFAPDNGICCCRELEASSC